MIEPLDAIARDRDARRRLVADLDSSFLVEAGAGTGKTTVLVARIVALVAAGRLLVERLVAVTFTELAAAELRDRVRRELERAARDGARAEAARARCAQAVAQLDRAAIGTVHAFAARLLHSFPIEAGLPPGFAVLDETEARFAFGDRFRTWLFEQVPADPGSPLAGAVRRAVALGLGPERLAEIAAGFQEHHDLLSPATTWPVPDPPDALAPAHEWGSRLLAVADLLPLAQQGLEDKLAREVLAVQDVARRLAAAVDQEAALAAFARIEARPPKQVGRQADWTRDAAGGEHPVRRIYLTFAGVRGEAERVLRGHRAAALSAILGHLRDLTLATVAERRRQGVATFTDLLVWARDLLRDQPAVRRRAHTLFDRISLDEFQDTDPLQAEIAWYLAAEPGQAEERDWRRLRLVPGRLCVVGDPKQSIYRFRRADLGIYDTVRAALAAGAAHAALTQSFRCAAPVMRWVNHHLEREMRPASGIQATYHPLLPRPGTDRPLAVPAGEREDVGSVAPEPERSGQSGQPAGSVHRLGSFSARTAAGRAWEEAEAIARCARRIHDDGWTVTERAEGGERSRKATYRDVCVLIPGRTALGTLERAFERRGVPYRMVSGSLVLRTQEVTDLRAVLRAIDDPGDQVALVAALRAPAYGCSDVELLAWVDAGGRLDYDDPGAGPPGQVAGALASLRAFHHQRLLRSPAETIEAVSRERLLAVGTFGEARRREAWRRLRYVVARARALAEAGHTSLRAVLDRLDALELARFHDAESPSPEADEDAVRVMTIHGAKGLEFPVVMLAGLGAPLRRPARGNARVLPDRVVGRLEVGCGPFQTAAFDGAREEAADVAERLRLLYVAATRARDHLVLCVHHGRDECHAARIVEHLDGHDHLCPPLDVSAARPGDGDSVATAAEEAASVAVPGQAGFDVESETAWSEARARQIARLVAIRVRTPTSLARRAGGGLTAEGAASPGGGAAAPPWPAETDREGDTAEDEALVRGEPEARVDGDPEGVTLTGTEMTRIGGAVHQVLATIELSAAGELDTLAVVVASRFHIPQLAYRVRELAGNLLASAAVRHAATCRRVWREVPVAAQVRGTIVEGRIDLLYELDGGRLGIVEYKLEGGGEPITNLPAHKAQAGAYVIAVQHATGRVVGEVALVFAETGGSATFAGPAVEELAALATAVLQRPPAPVTAH